MKLTKLGKQVRNAVVAGVVVITIGVWVNNHKAPLESEVIWKPVTAQQGDTVWTLVADMNEDTRVGKLVDKAQYSHKNDQFWHNGEFTLLAGETVYIPVVKK